MRTKGLITHLLLLFMFTQSSYSQTDLPPQKGIRITQDEQNPAFGNQPTTTTCEYTGDEKNGKCVIKNSKEEVLAEISFINDKKNGLAVRFEKNTIREQAVFRNDTLITKHVFDKGSLYKTELYTLFQDSVVLSEAYFFRAGGKKWMWKKYEGKELKTEIVYNKDGKIVLRTEYDKEGKANITKY